MREEGAAIGSKKTVLPKTLIENGDLGFNQIMSSVKQI